MVDFDDSSASCSALLAGKVDLAYTTLDAAIIAESQYEEDMLDVTAIVDESAGADGILVKNDINSIADLKGKTVGVSINPLMPEYPLSVVIWMRQLHGSHILAMR